MASPDLPRDPMFSPNPNWYAAVRMNPAAMVKDLDDPVALAAAEAMTPKTYLVYITAELELPWPGRPWYPYTVSVLGPSLRQEEPNKGITANMCIPVSPNTIHPTGREPIRPLRPFPYTKCYHWFGTKMDIRVLAQPEMFDLNRAIRLPPREQARIGRCWVSDHLPRLRENELMRDDTSGAEKIAPSPAQTRDPALEPRGDTDASSIAQSDEHAVPEPCSSSSAPSDSCSTRSSVSVRGAVDDVAAITRTVFDSPVCDFTALPLFNLWEDVGEHLKEEDIPNPLGLFEERDEIVKIVQDARVRAYAELTTYPQPSAQALLPGQSTGGAGSKNGEAFTPSKTPNRGYRGLVLHDMWRRLRVRVGTAARRVVYRLRAPIATAS